VNLRSLVLLGIRFFARRDDFHVGRPEPWRSLSGCRVPTHRDAPSLFAACRYVGQVARGTLWVRTDCQSVPASEARLSTARLSTARLSTIRVEAAQ
jgi:hypothetical protein